MSSTELAVRNASLFTVQAVPAEPAPSPFAGKAASEGSSRGAFRELGRPVDGWVIAAKGFVDILAAWRHPDPDEDLDFCPFGPGDSWIRVPPERAFWFSDSFSEAGRLSYAGIGLAGFREETASLAASIVIDPDIRALGHEPLTALVNLIEAAYLSAEDGGLFDLAELRRALGEAELTCRTIRFAADRREERKRALPAPVPDEPPRSRTVLVTLDQVAGMVNKSKRTLERYKTGGTLPCPAVEGGGGKADLWDWKTIRPWLESTFHQLLPERFPASPKS